ncbi:MAG: DUF512 domain-containing protein [Actinobacteria bacterium]|nr:DUF512 domain-containing protein [Actinomycetota bacterium]
MKEGLLMRRDHFGPAIVESIEPGSPAWGAGIRSGDRILSIERRPLRDVVDCYLLLAEGVKRQVRLERGSRQIDVTLDTAAGSLGIEFASPVFGRVMTCNNHCMFCFVDQLPPGLRGTLYVKDDDYRLSFLEGNFITLTNLRRGDLKRIAAEGLSPLYISLHATNPTLRRVIFGNNIANRALKALATLLDAGIEVHVQLVLMRGVNDGGYLDETLEDIRLQYGKVSSIGVVPVGITTSGRRRLPVDMGYDSDSAVRVLSQVERWRKTLGEEVLFASDEFFYLAGESPPSSDYYAGYPQAENGIGLARMFADSIDKDKAGAGSIPCLDGTAVVTSPMGAWALEPLELERLGVKLLICDNSLFGERVTVTGLLPGRDIARKLKVEPGVRRALVSEVSLSDCRFIVDLSIEARSARGDVEIVAVQPCAGALMEALRNRGGDIK